MHDTPMRGNPLFDGWYADPELHYFAGRYYIYPTTSRDPHEQTVLRQELQATRDGARRTQFVHAVDACVQEFQQVLAQHQVDWPTHQSTSAHLLPGTNRVPAEDGVALHGIASPEDPTPAAP
jgi:hypothetical protein